MTLFSIIFALALEQFKALPAERIAASQDSYAKFIDRHFNGGERRHAMTAWGVCVVLPALLLLALDAFLGRQQPVLGFLLTVAVLYLTVGFRQFSHYFNDIQLALRRGEIQRARNLLSAWCGTSAESLSSSTVARLSIEQGIVSSHRHVFAPLLWFFVLGPAGALLYRLGLAMAESWSGNAVMDGETECFGGFFRQAFRWLDWLPVRLTAATFAIVGDFEDAVYCWRTQARLWPDDASGILLSSGAGALGVRLGAPLPNEIGIDIRPELGLGDEADIEHLQSAIGLLWRALVLCLLLLALLTVASWVGS